jgi:hypothetical protein
MMWLVLFSRSNIRTFEVDSVLEGGCAIHNPISGRSDGMFHGRTYCSGVSKAMF